MKKKIGIIIAGCIVVLAVIGCAVWYFAAGNKNTEEPKMPRMFLIWLMRKISRSRLREKRQMK